jgi:NAD(P)-dependent dehydrogenase (short-subunit alcohol dehydrogenase family)
MMSQPGAQLLDLSGQVIVIAGAAGEIGSAMSAAFADHGATLVLAGLGASCALAASLRAGGIQALSYDGEASSAAGAQALVDFAVARCGRIDTLVVNAGAPGCTDRTRGPSEQAWEAAMAANLKCVFGLSARAIPGMAKHGGGNIVMMSGAAPLRGDRAIGLFGLSTNALTQLAGRLAVEWRPYGVRINAITPGRIRSAASALWEPEPAVRPGRAGEPDEVAGVALMLASRAGGFINGQNIVVDGGASANGAW